MAQFVAYDHRSGIWGSGTCPASAMADFNAAKADHLSVLQESERLSPDLQRTLADLEEGRVFATTLCQSTVDVRWGR